MTNKFQNSLSVLSRKRQMSYNCFSNQGHILKTVNQIMYFYKISNLPTIASKQKRFFQDTEKIVKKYNGIAQKK
jgi:hypothetical protein